jgi:hypothetical protein
MNHGKYQEYKSKATRRMFWVRIATLVKFINTGMICGWASIRFSTTTPWQCLYKLYNSKVSENYHTSDWETPNQDSPQDATPIIGSQGRWRAPEPEDAGVSKGPRVKKKEPKTEACRSPRMCRPPWMLQGPISTARGRRRCHGTQNRTLPESGLGFVVRLQIPASTPGDDRGGWGGSLWWSHGVRRPPGSAGTVAGGIGTVAGRIGRGGERVVGIGTSAGGPIFSGEKRWGCFCKIATAQLISGRREYINKYLLCKP